MNGDATSADSFETRETHGRAIVEDLQILPFDPSERQERQVRGAVYGQQGYVHSGRSGTHQDTGGVCTLQPQNFMTRALGDVVSGEYYGTTNHEPGPYPWLTVELVRNVDYTSGLKESH
ncbi:hypothetical protein RI444_05330 [Paenarthrobacter sp. AT5]|nr:MULTISPECIES: hypothetical protein [Paenarthrobacter]QSZ54891.1 hypothetical protein AYX19_19205 [Paenarthrobacter ureafaciens]WOC62063.1 hypothetical protein RI444_05330 [Paenarthrobacter sp. AT5]BCW83350.1 hypothetical protein NicSoilE8_10230 [Arthrobacter sp. NicSoilE8]